MEELRRDYSLLTRTTYTKFDLDNAAAYDCVIVSVSSLASRGYGIHRKVICVHAKTHEEATCKLKTASQTTKTSYQHCTQFPIYGVGQGTANAPIIFLFISSQLFKAHSGKSHGMIFKSPDGKLSYTSLLWDFLTAQQLSLVEHNKVQLTNY